MSRQHAHGSSSSSSSSGVSVCVYNPHEKTNLVFPRRSELLLSTLPSSLPVPHKALLDAGYDPNYKLHPWVRRSYDDERKSALFFAVSNNDVPSVKLLLEAGAMTNQDPVKCLQVVCVCVFVCAVYTIRFFLRFRDV